MRRWIIAAVFMVLVLAISACADLPATGGANASPPDKAQSAYLDPRELAADPKQFVGRNIYLQGETLTVDQKNNYTGCNSWHKCEGRIRRRNLLS